MNQNQIMKQMIEFNQATFDSIFKANMLLQDQFEKIADTIMDQTAFIPAETRKTMDKWSKAVKSGQQNFKKYMDESFKKFSEVFTD